MAQTCKVCAILTLPATQTPLVPNQRNPCFLCKNFYHKGHKGHKEGFILLKSLCSL